MSDPVRCAPGCVRSKGRARRGSGRQARGSEWGFPALRPGCSQRGHSRAQERGVLGKGSSEGRIPPSTRGAFCPSLTRLNLTCSYLICSSRQCFFPFSKKNVRWQHILVAVWVSPGGDAGQAGGRTPLWLRGAPREARFNLKMLLLVPPFIRPCAGTCPGQRAAAKAERRAAVAGAPPDPARPARRPQQPQLPGEE